MAAGIRLFMEDEVKYYQHSANHNCMLGMHYFASAYRFPTSAQFTTFQNAFT